MTAFLCFLRLIDRNEPLLRAGYVVGMLNDVAYPKFYCTKRYLASYFPRVLMHSNFDPLQFILSLMRVT